MILSAATMMESATQPQALLRYPQSPKEEGVAALEALLRYEALVRVQDAESHALDEHLRPLFHTIRQLGTSNIKTVRKNSRMNEGSEASSRTIFPRYSRRSRSTNRATSYQALEDEESHGEQITYVCIKNAYIKLTRSHNDDIEATSIQLIKSDRQLMYILAEILGKETDLKSHEEGISYAEFKQCYRIAICGMQSLEDIIQSSSADNNIVQMKSRIIDRTTTMIRSFGPSPSEKQLPKSPLSPPKSPQKSPKKLRSSSENKNLSFARLFSGDSDGSESVAELEDEIDFLRRLLAVKDKQMNKLMIRMMTDHTNTVESMSSEANKNAEDLKRYIRKRRKRRRLIRRSLMMIALSVLAVCYSFGVIKVVIQDGQYFPLVTFHLNDFMNDIAVVKTDDLDGLKREHLKQKRLISALEFKEDAFRSKLKGAQANLERTAKDLKKAHDELRKKDAMCANVQQCRSELRKSKEEISLLEERQKNDCLAQGVAWYKKLLLGPHEQ